MLIPSIDLMNGKVVQLVRGERLEYESDDVDAWAERFARSPLVQLIDLDAALGHGGNDDLIARLAARLPCQIGGGVRSIDRAHELLGAGARRVIVGSALFTDGGVDLARAEAFAAAIDADRLVAAVDARHGHVVTHGWTRVLELSSVDAVRALEPFVGAFLYTHIDTEGTMTGLPLAPVLAVQAATRRRLIAAGGIRSMTEVDALDRLGIDAVVGMAIYTGALSEMGPGNAARLPGVQAPEEQL